MIFVLNNLFVFLKKFKNSYEKTATTSFTYPF